jgi:hypothetical protein
MAGPTQCRHSAQWYSLSVTVTSTRLTRFGIPAVRRPVSIASAGEMRTISTFWSRISTRNASSESKRSFIACASFPRGHSPGGGSQAPALALQRPGQGLDRDGHGQISARGSRGGGRTGLTRGRRAPIVHDMLLCVPSRDLGRAWHPRRYTPAGKPPHTRPGTLTSERRH